MLILRLGDPHVRVSNIDESDALIDFVADTAIKERIDRIEILGDLYHNHSVIRLEVLEFWTCALERLSDICEVVALVGNHDVSGTYGDSYSSLDIFQKVRNKNLHIVNLPRVMGPIGYVPYTYNEEKFVDDSNYLVSYGAKVLVCHQTFNGSKYENGMYAPDGIDPEKLNFDTIISGHIHAQQRFGKVIYPGTARWDTASDANQKKGIWIFQHDDITGKILSEEFLDTSHVCRPIRSFTVNEGEEIPVWNESDRASVGLVGSSAWISSIKDQLKGKCSIKSKITDRHTSQSRKTGLNLEDFLKNTFPSAIDKELLIKTAREYGIL